MECCFQMAKRKKIKAKLGRDPTFGRVVFKTGKCKTIKDKLRKRNSKLSRKIKRDETELP